MSTVELSDQDWGQLMNILATTKEHPWTVTNPLLMKIGEQLRQGKLTGGAPPTADELRRMGGNSQQEARHE